MVPGELVLRLVYFIVNVRQVPFLIFHNTSEIRCRQLMRLAAGEAHHKGMTTQCRLRLIIGPTDSKLTQLSHEP